MFYVGLIDIKEINLKWSTYFILPQNHPPWHNDDKNQKDSTTYDYKTSGRVCLHSEYVLQERKNTNKYTHEEEPLDYSQTFLFLGQSPRETCCNELLFFKEWKGLHRA